jgi:hypothetical protein
MTAAFTYTPPSPLAPLHILDLLELAGSQQRAGAALSMHQTTVCRSLRLMQQQFRLVPRQGTAVCRHGHNACLHHLRLAYREHRLMAGLLRIGTDGLHQRLLNGLAMVQQVPPRCRSGDHWADLVRHGLLDGAIVSSLGLERELLPGQVPSWEGLKAVPLGELELQLVASTAEARRVLLPRQAAMPLLRQAVAWRGLAAETQPAACQEEAAWLKRARDRQLALPLCSGLLGPEWLARHQLQPLAEQPAWIEQLWLLLPDTLAAHRTARHGLQLLQTRINQARIATVHALQETMPEVAGNQHENQC